MSHNVAHIVAHPEEYGFAWGTTPIRTDGGRKVLSNDAPCVIHKDVARMSEVFGETYFSDMANGTSGRVRDQRIDRNMLQANARTPHEDMQIAIVESMLNIRTRRGGTVTVFRSMDGVDHKTEVEMKQANIAFLVDNGLDADKAREMVLGSQE